MTKQKMMKKSLALFICAVMVVTTVFAQSPVSTSAAASVKLNYAKKTVTVGSSLKLKLKKKPAGSKILKISWKSNKKKIATVSKKGVVKAKKAGPVKITCTVTYRKAKKGKKTEKCYCNLVVKAKKKKTSNTQSENTNNVNNTVQTTENVTTMPTTESTAVPTMNPPTTEPTAAPTIEPTTAPTIAPTATPTIVPTTAPTTEPPTAPTATPTTAPTIVPSIKPTVVPTIKPTTAPTARPGSHLSANGIETIDNGVMRSGIDAYDIVHDMGVGINLGNTLESVGDWINNSSVENYETAWGAPVTTQEMISGMKAAGFHSIRIPVAWSNMMEDDGTYTINEAYFNRVETVMNYAFNEGMYVIINIHFDGGWWARFGSKTESERTQAMVKYKTMWTQIANRYEEYSDHLIFESANEELGARLNSTDDYEGSGYFTTEAQLYEQLTKINQAFVDVVRGSGGNNASRFLLMAGYDTDITATCDEKYVLPTDTIDGHMMVSIHYYSPATYCTVDNPENSWGYRDSWGTQDDILEMQSALKKMSLNFVNKGIPVIIGEYGVIDGKNTDETTYRKEGRDVFISTICEYALEHGMCPMLWDTNIIYSRDSCKVVNETEAANYLLFEKKAQESEVYRPTITTDKKVSWTGTLTYEGWNPGTAIADDDNNTFTVKVDGGTFCIEDVSWSDYQEPVLTLSAESKSGSINYVFAKTATGGNEYWAAIQESDVIESDTWNLTNAKQIALKDWNLTGKEKIYFAFKGLEEFDGKVTITVSDAAE